MNWETDKNCPKPEKNQFPTHFSIRIPSPYCSFKFPLSKSLPINSLQSKQGVKKAKQVSSQRHLIS